MYGVAGDKATDLDQIGRFLFNFGNPTNSFYGLIPRRLRARKRRYYGIQKIINTNSFYGDKKILSHTENYKY